MRSARPAVVCGWLAVLTAAAPAADPLTTAAALAAAVRDGAAGATVTLAAGTFEIAGPLDLKPGMTLTGAGIGKTVIAPAAGWSPATTALPDPEMTQTGLDTAAYLVRLEPDAAGVTISDLTLRGPRVHGAIYAWHPTGLHLHHVRVRDTVWCGVRTFGMARARIHDCEFRDAGGRWDKGRPGVTGGTTGGAIFAVWMSDCDIADNRFTRTRAEPAREFYGVKVREGRRTRVHHNTVAADFALEFPFDADEDVEIDHNAVLGTVSVPKYAGGPVPKSGRTFHIHHNYFTKGYAVEFARNGVEIDHNLFDFDPAADGGNLVSGFGDAPAPGPASFHNNLVNNPGRGVYWVNEVFNNLEVRNNHIVTRTTATPRTDGLFGFNPKCDFSTIVLKDNRVECRGQPRPLLRCEESYAAVVQNNTLVNVADAGRLKNPKAARPVGLERPLKFACGVKGEYAVDGWAVTRPKE